MLLTMLQGAVSLGLLWSLFAIAVHLTFRVLETPDLSVEGTIILGAGIAARFIADGFNPFFATFLAMCIGCIGGLVTGILHTKFKIPPILSGILTMIGSYSVAIRIMGTSNVGLPVHGPMRVTSVYTFLHEAGFPHRTAVIIFALAFVALAATLLYCFYGTEVGAALRATGNNRQMAKAQGVNTEAMIILGLIISNGFVGLAGALIAQNDGAAEITMGAGTIVIGLASVTIAEVLFRTRRFWVRMVSLILGAILYQIVIALVLMLGMAPTDLRLFTAIIVAIALTLPLIRDKLSGAKKRRAS